MVCWMPGLAHIFLTWIRCLEQEPILKVAAALDCRVEGWGPIVSHGAALSSRGAGIPDSGNRSCPESQVRSCVSAGGD
jgi:hypothetical protein